MELVCIYEDCRAEEHERFIKQQFKEAELPEMVATKPVIAQHVSEIMQKVIPPQKQLKASDAKELIEVNKNMNNNLMIDALCKAWHKEFESMKPIISETHGGNRIVYIEVKGNAQSFTINQYLEFKMEGK